MNLSIFIKTGHSSNRVLLQEILFLKASDKYVKVFTHQQSYLVLDTFTRIEQELPKDIFFRVHRSFIVSLLHVSQFQLRFLIVNGIQIPVSDRYRSGLMKRFKETTLQFPFTPLKSSTAFDNNSDDPNDKL